MPEEPDVTDPVTGTEEETGGEETQEHHGWTSMVHPPGPTTGW